MQRVPPFLNTEFFDAIYHDPFRLFWVTAREAIQKTGVGMPRFWKENVRGISAVILARLGNSSAELVGMQKLFRNGGNV